MRRIYKYTLAASPASSIAHEIPARGRIVHFQLVDLNPTIWVEVDDAQTTLHWWEFLAHGTGHPIDDTEQYVGTYVDEPHVWHVYRRPVG